MTAQLRGLDGSHYSKCKRWSNIKENLWPRSITVQKPELHQATSQALYLCKQCIACKNWRPREALGRKWDTFQLSTRESIWEFNRKTGESIWRINQQFNPRHLHVLLKWKSTCVKKQTHPQQILTRSSAASEQIGYNTKWQSWAEDCFRPHEPKRTWKPDG